MTLRASELVDGLNELGVSTVAGVPCSYLTPLINRFISDPGVRYLSATQEGEAIAVAAGAWLGGGLGCALAQNSGLGNMVNPLTSLLQTARIPAVLVVTWRGRSGETDEPQHELMGTITHPLLDLMGITHETVTADPDALPGLLGRCADRLAAGDRAHALVLPSSTVADEPLHEPPRVARTGLLSGNGQRRDVRAHTRLEALEALLAELPPDAAVISTTGKTSRELFTIGDQARNFYVVGAMGSAAAVGLGVSLQGPRPVVVVDGDGSLLMRLGTLATVAAYAPTHLVHVVLDNGVHDSTGGQQTVSAGTDLAAVAAACGYAHATTCGTLPELAQAMRRGLTQGGPCLVRMFIRPGSMKTLGRPTLSPPDVARRFRSFVTGGDGRRLAPSANGTGR